MNNINNSLLILATIFVVAFSSCGHDHKEGDGHNHGAEADSHATTEGDKHSEDSHEEGVHLSKEQIQTIGLEFGTVDAIKVNDYVTATGTLGLPPNAFSSVSAKSEGILQGFKKFVEGNYIKKGAVIAYVSNTDFIVKQQNYLEAKAELHLKQLDLKRQKSLVEANAGVEKSLQTIQAEVAVWQAKASGLAKQLAYLGISPNRVSTNNMREQIAIVAPMSGYISSINMHNGMYVVPSVSLMEIISSDHLHLELDVFEKDIAKIKVGQKIAYTVPALGNTIYYGDVSVIGKEFNTQTKTVRVHGHLDGIKPTFLKDLFINAKLWLTNVTTDAVPNDAIIKDGNTSFIYVANNDNKKDEISFKQISVIPGANNDGFTAIKFIDSIPQGMQIVTKGAYYVYAQSKAGELEHEH